MIWLGMTRQIALAFVLLVAGCAAVPDTGESVPFASFYTRDYTLVVPPNAPSISQQYRVYPDGKPETGENEHLGIDIHSPKGTAILAAFDGEVTATWVDPMYGRQITISHGPELRTQYKHLSAHNVAKGQKVKRGEKIGELGKTGVLASNILHLHFEVLRRQSRNHFLQEDPHLYWVDGPGRITCFQPGVAYPKDRFLLTYPVVCG